MSDEKPEDTGTVSNPEERLNVSNITQHRRATSADDEQKVDGRRYADRPDDPVYDFEHLGLKIAESLVFAAEAQVVEANSLLEETKALAESIREQVKIQTAALTDLNGRLKTFGSQMLDAHRQFNGGGREVEERRRKGLPDYERPPIGDAGA